MYVDKIMFTKKKKEKKNIKGYTKLKYIGHNFNKKNIRYFSKSAQNSKPYVPKIYMEDFKKYNELLQGPKFKYFRNYVFTFRDVNRLNIFNRFIYEDFS